MQKSPIFLRLSQKNQNDTLFKGFILQNEPPAEVHFAFFETSSKKDYEILLFFCYNVKAKKSKISMKGKFTYGKRAITTSERVFYTRT